MDKIREILEDIDYYQPGMIIEEEEPFWFRMHPDWVKDKTEQLTTLIQEEVEEFARTSTAYNKGKRALMKEAKEYGEK